MALAARTIETTAVARDAGFRSAGRAGALVVALLGAGLYLLTLGPGLGGTIDSAEFQHAAYNLGIVHPTGYPLYLLLGRLWLALLPAGEIAWRMNLLSAVCAVAALLVVYATVLHLGWTPAGGMLAAALVATHALVWETAEVAEVNSLNLLLVVATIYALLRWAGDGPRRWPLEVAALLYGLALSHHRTSLLIAPAALVFVVWMHRRGRPLGRGALARSLVLLVLPALFYLYIPLRAATTAWYTNTWANFSAEVGGASAWPVILDTLQRPLLPRVGLVWGQVFPGVVGAGVALLAALGMGLWARRDRPVTLVGATTRPVLALYGLSALAIGAVMVVYDVDVIGDYLALIVPLAATWVGVGAGRLLALARQSSRLVRGRLPLGSLALGLVLLAPLAGQVRANYANSDYSHFVAPRQFWDQLAAGAGTAPALPPAGILIAGWARYNELRYRQIVEGWRRDLYPVVLDDLLAGGHLGLIDEWLAQGRGVYLLEGTPDVLDHFAADQQGPVWRLTRRQEVQTPPLAHPLAVTFGSDLHLLGYTLEPTEPRPGGEMRITLFWQTTARLQERYVVFTHLVDDNLHKIGQRDDEPGRGYQPTVNWRPGETIVDTLVMPILPDAAPGSYHLIVGLYTRIGEKRLQATGPGGKVLGDYWEMTAVRVAR